MASPSARKSPTIVPRVPSGLFATARAKRSVKRISGTMAPVAAAAIGFVGSSEPIHAASVWPWPPAVSWLAASTAPSGSGGRAAPRGRSR